MRIIGLTGRSGSGKTTVASIAETMGIPVLDCDRIYDEITSRPTPCLAAIASVFGEDSVRDGKLCRSVLREKVFSDAESMTKLNALTARYMGDEVRNRMASLSSQVVLLDAPTLFQSGMDSECEFVIGVIAPEEDCVRRIMARDAIPREAACLRLAQQPSAEFYLEKCRFILENTGGIDLLRENTSNLLLNILKGEF